MFSGPYVVKSFSSTELDYKRNDNWWGAKSGAFKLPAPLEIHRPWIGDDATAQQMLVTNDSDIGGATTPEHAVRDAGAKSEAHALQRSSMGWVDPCPRMLTLNTTIAPWDKKEMRHALSYAMNRRQIVDVVYEGAGGDAAVSNFIFPTYKALEPYRDAAADILAPLAEYSPDKANQLIESQGYTMGGGSGNYVGPDGTTLALDVVGPPFMEPWGRMVVQQLQGRRRRRQPAAHRVGHLPRPDRARQLHGRRRLGWLRQRRRAVVRHEPL